MHVYESVSLVPVLACQHRKTRQALLVTVPGTESGVLLCLGLGCVPIEQQ